MGVNLGVLPTKGLTLPLMSYGGSAILMNLVALAIVVRVDMENRSLMRGGRAVMPHLVIMAAGTGGHIIPGLAVAREMQRRGWSVSWLGTATGMENRLVPPTRHPAGPSGLQRPARQGLLHRAPPAGCGCSRPSGMRRASCAGAAPAPCWAWAAMCASPVA
jgi:hypothetical protein